MFGESVLFFLLPKLEMEGEFPYTHSENVM